MKYLLLDSGSHLGHDRLLDLAEGLLPADLRATALAHLKSCPACETRFQDIAASQARAQSEASTVLGGGATRFGRATVHARPLRQARWLLVTGAVAAALAIALFSARDRVPRRIASQMDSSLPVARLRGAIRDVQSSAADSAVLAGLDAFNRNDYDAARRILESTRGKGGMETVRRVYLGSVRLQLGDAAGARSILLGLPEQRIPEPWKSEARWTLALALAGSDHHEAADSLLQVLSAEQGPVADRAKAYRLGAARGR